MNCETIFIRNTTQKENTSETTKKRAWNKIEPKEGFKIVYKPYGEQGRGFYYIKVII